MILVIDSLVCTAYDEVHLISVRGIDNYCRFGNNKKKSPIRKFGMEIVISVCVCGSVKSSQSKWFFFVYVRENATRIVMHRSLNNDCFYSTKISINFYAIAWSSTKFQLFWNLTNFTLAFSISYFFPCNDILWCSFEKWMANGKRNMCVCIFFALETNKRKMNHVCGWQNQIYGGVEYLSIHHILQHELNILVQTLLSDLSYILYKDIRFWA